MDIDYLVVKTGYTCRILDKTPQEINEDISSVWFDKDDKDGEEGDEDKLEDIKQYLINRNCLFIKDSLWGTGFYKLNVKKNNLLDITDALESHDGYIVFKVEDLTDCMIIANHVSKINYCANYGINDTEFLTTKKGSKILLFRYDTSSG